MQEIIRARQEGGPFQSLDDFCERVDMRQINRRMLECMIKVGALDSFGTRAQLLAATEQIVSVSAQVHQARDVGQMTMFDMFGADEQTSGGIVLPEVPAIPNKVQLGWEKELVGFYVSEHPMTQVMPSLEGQITCFCGEVNEDMHNQTIAVAGLVSWVRPHVTRKGDLMAFVHMEDIQGSVEVVVFPRTYAETRDLWQEDKILIVRGRVDAERSEPNLICEAVRDHVVLARPVESTQEIAEPKPDYLVEPDPVPEPEPDPMPAPESPEPPRQPRHLQITIHRSGNPDRDKKRISEVYGMLRQRRGQDQFTYFLIDDHRRVQIDFPNATTDWSDTLAQSLQSMLGHDALQVT
jgi:DNA polymerase-3 subunit alpha